MKLIYIFDPICGWCYGFTPVIQALQQEYAGKMDFEILSGGMLTGDNRRPASTMHAYILQAHTRVEETTGVKFGEAFLHQYLASQEIMDSVKPSIALTVFKQYQPDKAIDFAHDMQVALNYDGISLNGDAIYEQLAAKYGIPSTAFIEKMQEESNRYATQQEFQQVQQWGITGFPAAILDTGKQLYMIAKGYTPLARLQEVIEKIKTEEQSAKQDA
jgi:putative protein-disulfide isomerase